MDLSTKYLGLSLRNPIIVASCGLTKTADQIKKCEDAGAGAVVMKSLFEEQIREMDSGISESVSMHTEVLDYLRAEIDMHYGPRDYLEIIKQAKKEVSIPVIASVNCYTSKWWVSYAKQLEAAGADALELNMYVLPYDLEKSSLDLEFMYVDVLKAVKEQAKIPVALKLSPYFTSLANFAKNLDENGVDGMVLFNRFIQPDMDLKNLKSINKPSFDDPIGFDHALRWVALLSGSCKFDIAASGNIRNAEGVIKQLLAGAAAVQIASLFYKNGLETIADLLKGIESWMAEHNFSSIEDFRGKLNQANNPQSEAFIRAQYVKAIS